MAYGKVVRAGKGAKVVGIKAAAGIVQAIVRVPEAARQYNLGVQRGLREMNARVREDEMKRKVNKFAKKHDAKTTVELIAINEQIRIGSSEERILEMLKEGRAAGFPGRIHDRLSDFGLPRDRRKSLEKTIKPTSEYESRYIDAGIAMGERSSYIELQIERSRRNAKRLNNEKARAMVLEAFYRRRDRQRLGMSPEPKPEPELDLEASRAPTKNIPQR